MSSLRAAWCPPLHRRGISAVLGTLLFAAAVPALAQNGPQPMPQPVAPTPPPGAAAQPEYPGQPQPMYPAQPYPGQPAYPNQPYPGQPVYPNQPYPGQPMYPAQPYPGQPYPSQPGYGVPPGYPTQPGYYQPQPVMTRNVVGYKTGPRVGLIIAGSVVLGASYLITVGVTAFTQTVFDSSGRGTYWPLYLPVVGPWIEMGYVPNDGTQGLARMGLAVSGLAQATGLALLITGAVLKTKSPIYAQRLNIAPTAYLGGGGLMAAGRF